MHGEYRALRRAGANRLKKWELALLCAVAYTVLSGAAPCCAWWGTVYPELSPDGGALPAALSGGGVALRLRLLEWLQACLRALGAL